MCEQAVVRTFAVANKSFTASGMPSSGPALPAWMRASLAFAIALARSGVSSTQALSTRAFSMAAISVSASSTAEKFFFFRPSRASANVSEFKSLTAFHYRFALIRRRWRGGRGCVRGRIAGKVRGIVGTRARKAGRRCGRQIVQRDQQSELTGDAHLLDHFWNQEEIVRALRRVLEHRLGVVAGRDHVVPLLHRHRRHRGHRLDALDVHLLQLLDEGEHGVELGAQVLHLAIGDGDACQMRDAADGVGAVSYTHLTLPTIYSV